MELSLAFFYKFNLWPVRLQNFLSLKRGLNSVENLVLSYPLVISLIHREHSGLKIYSKVPRSANLATASDSERPPYPKWVKRFDMNMNGMNLLVIFWMYMFCVSLKSIKGIYTEGSFVDLIYLKILFFL